MINEIKKINQNKYIHLYSSYSLCNYLKKNIFKLKLRYHDYNLQTSNVYITNYGVFSIDKDAIYINTNIYLKYEDFKYDLFF